MKAICSIDIHNISGVVKAEKPHVQYSFSWVTINPSLYTMKRKDAFNSFISYIAFFKAMFFYHYYTRKI